MPMIARHAFTTDEWHRMGELGLFDEHARAELLDGDIMDMTPIGSRHAGIVNRLNRMLVTAVGNRAVVAPQNPVFLDKYSEPQPDLALLTPRGDDYAHGHAEPGEILLLIEVSDSSLAYDRDRKAPYYARTGIPECWIVDLTSLEVLVLRSPGPNGYQVVDRRRAGDVLSMAALDEVSVSVAEMFAGLA
jgi:Uma2 family endonuclease